MKKRFIKNVACLLVVVLMIFARSLSAQTVTFTVQGNVSDLNGNAIANTDVYFTDDTTGFNFSMAMTDVNGDYMGTFTPSPNGTMSGIIYVATEDCNLDMEVNIEYYTPNITTITSDFIICSSANPPNCIDSTLIDTTIACSMIYDPVCGCDSVTYSNDCVAENYGGVTSYTYGPCGSAGSSCQAYFTAMNIGFNPNAVPVVMQFTDMSSGNANNWIWDFGDGATGIGQMPVHTYAVPGTYLACLTIEEIDANGTIICTDTYCDSIWADTISINPPPFCYADFTSTQVAASDSTHFTNLSSGTSNTTSYFWDFGDNSISTDENPVHLYATSGWYYVCLTIMDSTNNCYNTYCDYINIQIASSGSCQAYFSGSPGWNPNSYEFFDYSGGNITNWSWDFGDGNTSNLQNPIHTYAAGSQGLFNVCLTIEELGASGAVLCADTYCDSIWLFNQQSCYADFFGQNLGNNEATFFNYSYPQTGPTWNGNGEVDIDYGDGTSDFNIGSAVNHTYAAAGTYYVCITVWETDSAGTVICDDTYCDSVMVTSGTMPCQADFYVQYDSMWVTTTNPIGTITSTYMADVFAFYDLSTPVNMIQSWQWDMGDNGVGTYLQGTSSTSQNPIYEYDTLGTYIACLTIATVNGCIDTSCDSIFFYQNQQTAVNDMSLEIMNVYPNPATNRLNVSISSLSNSAVKVNIVNMMGQNVATIKTLSVAENISMDVSTIANGVYSVEVVQNGNKQYKRVVINR